ncbi:NnrS family protein [Sulfurimonas crateris]|uniref:NnrS family protein n=1 Tax=Sulfurimonas crateris TaxID=2574727 RepID=A0A4U2Z5T1_9BACT|nr:NnrS family protein [Sulfurimonas crateris]TKI69666.1 NnrS family protein [Sulfurimonas crateris]
MSQEEKPQILHATNHYLYYPDEKDVPAYLAYGFRPVFLLLAPYMIISMLLWGLVWSGAINIPFMDNVLVWHVYEMLFGILTIGALAFLSTGLPELFPGLIPLIGKRLKYVVLLWVAGRISFWLIDVTGVYLTALLNLLMLGWLIWFGRRAVLDKLQRHASLGYTLLALLIIEAWFFASMAGHASTPPIDILKIALGGHVVLILLALRRVNMEAVNELMEDKGIDDVYVSRPPLTNLAAFSVILFSVVEFLYPANSALGWIGLAVGAAILAVTNDYILKDKFILNQPYVIYLSLIFIMLGVGYALMGWAILAQDTHNISHFRHFITSGGIGLSYVMVMMIISWIHTGRHLTSNIYTHSMVAAVVVATLMRGSIPFFENYSDELYLYSSLIWTLPFIIYIKLFFRFLTAPRADGVKG